MNRILKRTVFFIRVRFTSPLNLSSGEDEWTDADILRDCNGKPFVPGSSLAGAVRAYLEKEKNTSCMMGYTDVNDTGKMSSLFISDLTFCDEKLQEGVRDGVALDRNKVAVTGSKYDMEILEGGAEGGFYMELAVRENDAQNEELWNQELDSVFRGIQDGEIRLGRKKTRGFGKFKILSLSVKTYQKENYRDYADAYEESTWTDAPDEKDTWIQKTAERKMVHITVPLRLNGGISIRQYAARKNQPDFVHLMDHKKPVIPGSSWAGAVRHRTERILCELEESGAQLPMPVNEILNIAFGYMNGTQACVSNIIFSESEIKDYKLLTMVRTGISRFESSVRDGALYKERTCVGGTVDLEITVRKYREYKDEKSKAEDWIIGILLLALQDLQNGYLAVGGQTAIGRGVFSKNGPIKIDGETGREKEYIQNACRCLAENGGKK